MGTLSRNSLGHKSLVASRHAYDSEVINTNYNVDTVECLSIDEESTLLNHMGRGHHINILDNKTVRGTSEVKIETRKISKIYREKTAKNLQLNIYI